MLKVSANIIIIVNRRFCLGERESAANDEKVADVNSLTGAEALSIGGSDAISDFQTEC